MQLSYKQYARKAIVYCMEDRLQFWMLLIWGVRIRWLWAESLCGYQRQRQPGVRQGDSVVFLSVCQGGVMSSWFSQCDNQVWLASRYLLKLILANLASYQCWWDCSSTNGAQEAGVVRTPVSAQSPHSDSQGCPCEQELKGRCCNGSKCLDCTSLVNLQCLLLQMT